MSAGRPGDASPSILSSRVIRMCPQALARRLHAGISAMNSMSAAAVMSSKSFGVGEYLARMDRIIDRL
jgi:hypothetical protein